jgi:dTDP-4-dehydrorhamnose reductase
MEIPIRDLTSPYPLFKLLSEELIKKVKRDNFAILRPSMMISSDSPKNNLRRLVECRVPKLSVTKESEYNVISYFDVLNTVKYFMDSRQSGVYNLASSKNIKLADLAEKLNKEVEWGRFTYALNHIDNTKISKIITAYSRTSEQVIYELFKRS